MSRVLAVALFVACSLIASPRPATGQTCGGCMNYMCSLLYDEALQPYAWRCEQGWDFCGPNFCLVEGDGNCVLSTFYCCRGCEAKSDDPRNRRSTVFLAVADITPPGMISAGAPGTEWLLTGRRGFLSPDFGYVAGCEGALLPSSALQTTALSVRPFESPAPVRPVSIAVSPSPAIGMEFAGADQGGFGGEWPSGARPETYARNLAGWARGS